ncbi:MAG: NUDIX hydrolase [Succinivibrionaceae bacterium]
MEEMVPIVNDKNEIIEIVPRSVMRKNCLPHRASYIVLQNSEGKYYIEVRTLTKDYCPGMLDACIGGVVQEGENDIIESAKRELLEEMGISCDLKYFGWYKIQSSLDTFTYAGLFFGIYDGKYVKQDSEVSDVLMLTYSEILERENEFTRDSIIALKEIRRILG